MRFFVAVLRSCGHGVDHDIHDRHSVGNFIETLSCDVSNHKSHLMNHELLVSLCCSCGWNFASIRLSWGKYLHCMSLYENGYCKLLLKTTNPWKRKVFENEAPVEIQYVRRKIDHTSLFSLLILKIIRKTLWSEKGFVLSIIIDCMVN